MERSVGLQPALRAIFIFPISQSIPVFREERLTLCGVSHFRIWDIRVAVQVVIEGVIAPFQE